MKLPVVLAVAALFSQSVSAQPPSADSTVPSVSQSLAALDKQMARVPGGALALNFAEWRVRVALSRLLELSKNWPAESPPDYRRNMARHVLLLDQEIASGQRERLTALLEALADDLEVKLEHCNKSGGKLGGSVAVQVRTVQGGQQIRNWQVFYVPKVLEALGSTTADRFPQLSSPTQETLVPGRYVMWVRDSASPREGERVVVKVGEGRKDLILDLPVPGGATP